MSRIVSSTTVVRYLGAAAAAACALGVHSAQAGSCDRAMVAVLTSAQENPPNNSTALGAATVLVDTVANEAKIYVVFAGLSAAEAGAHVHGPADPGQDAGVKFGLPPGNPKVATWNYNEADEPDLLAGRMYINIHSNSFPAGEIRGQLVTHHAELDGQQENPPVNTNAKGWGVFTINTAANKLSYYIVFSGLSSAEVAAHIHGMSNYGTNAGVLHPLPAGSPKVGVWNYNEADEERILRGMTYVNIHSENFGGGEIRGQIVPIVVPADGTQEVPPNNSRAAGVGMFAIDTAGNSLGFDIRHKALVNEQAAHIHGFAGRGEEGGVLFALPVGERKLGTWNYSANQEDNILAGLTYVNMHTINFGGGEIRGQIEFAGLPSCAGDVDGDGRIGLSDLASLLAAFDTRAGQAGYLLCADFDGDGVVGLSDLATLLSVFDSDCA
jgi:Cu/Zn superoxide dismutase